MTRRTNVILFDDPSGVGLCWPAHSCKLTDTEIAKKDIKAGTKYKIIPASDIPTDTSFIDAWEWDFSDFDGLGENTEK
tara:strand:- start:146 stop:379 length:234 start_codon:yes stop_codon:yes gene_type:complete